MDFLILNQCLVSQEGSVGLELLLLLFKDLLVFSLSATFLRSVKILIVLQLRT